MASDGHWAHGAWIKPYAGTTRAPHIWPDVWGVMALKAKKAEFAGYECALAREKALGEEELQKWVRYDLQTSSHLGTLPDGPEQDVVLRRVSRSLASGKLLDGEGLSGVTVAEENNTHNLIVSKDCKPETNVTSVCDSQSGNFVKNFELPALVIIQARDKVGGAVTVAIGN